MGLEGYADVQALHDGARTTVLRARRVVDGRTVVIKQLRSPFPSAAELTGLRREFDLARAAAGPSVVAVSGLHEGGGTAWLEMEDCGSCTLETLCAPRPPPLRSALQIACGLVGALEQIHRAGVVHKDVTPSNVMVDPQSLRVTLIDFGIASTLGLQVARQAERFEGTPSYLSPEQTGRMNRPLDWRSDYYSLGATLYYLLTGAPPFSVKDPLEAVHAHIARRAAPPREVNPAVPEAVSNLVMALLEKLAEDRYQSAAGLRHDLERCLAELREKGSIQPFALRGEDRSETLRVPDTLYGRAAEIEALGAAIGRVAGGSSEAIFVTGAAGSGKTSLVGEVHHGGAIHRSLFLAGKFEQFQRDVPYLAVLQALRGLVHQLLALPPDRIDAWRARLGAALGDTGGVLTEAIPELELLVGKQPTPGAVSALEAENRFRNTLLRLVSALPAEGRPVVLFLDDLQWADRASLELLERLLLEPDLHRVLLLGTWHSNEVDAAHPLTRLLARAADLNAKISRIELAPLGADDVKALLADTLDRPGEEVVALAQLCHAWTGGNPFLLHRVVDRLGDKGLLRRTGTRWTWDLAEITAGGLGEDSASFVAGRLAELPEETRRALEVASCFGTAFRSAALANALQRPPAAVAASLAPALALKLVHPVDPGWWPEAPDDLDYEFAFTHDRIQEAAHARLTPEAKREISLRVGRQLRQQPDANLFDVVHHLNLAMELLTADERTALLGLDAEAGRRAMRSGAYAPALQLLEEAVALLPADSWNEAPETTRELLLDAARAGSLSGASDRMDAHLAPVLAHAATPLQRAAALEIQSLHLAGRDVLAAIDTALQAMAELGVSLPRQPTLPDVQAAVGAAMTAIAARGHDAVVALPELEDPAAIAIVRLANSIMAPAYLAAPLLLPVLGAEIVKQTVERGVTPPATFGYAVVALVLTAGGALEPAREIALLALRLMERFHDRGHDARPGHVVFGLVLPFSLPLREALARHRSYLPRALAGGDHEYAMWIAHNASNMSFYCGYPLEGLLAESTRECQAMRRLGQRTQLDCTEPFRRLALALRGETARAGYLDEDSYTEQAGLAELVASNSRGAVYILQTLRLLLRYLFRDLPAALEMADAGEPFADGAPATYHVVVFQQTLALVCAALAETAPSPEARATLLTRARANRALLAPLAAHAPHNHRHRLALIDAELARVEGDALAAIDGYDAAIAAARENGFVQDEALANELAGRFYRARGKPTAARAYLFEACSAWSRWGATAKVQQLEAELPDSIVRLGPSGSASITAGTTGSDLDLTTLSKATLAMSSEIKTDRLVARVLEVSVQNAGATRAMVLISREGTLRLEASHGAGLSPRGTPLAELSGVPASILQYVARTGAKLVLPDARTDARFASDEALSPQRPLSVLAIPLTSRGQLAGLIYLENGLTPDAFPPGRIHLQEMLGAQAVISLENARLYDEMETQVARRTQELSVANDKLANANVELEQRVQAKVAEALAAAEQLARLNQRLQERVRDRSEELARALNKLSSPEQAQGGLAAGTVLAGRVRIVRPLGKGGMGAVYLAEDLATHEPIAVKVILGTAFADGTAMQRFLRESRAAASVSHPAVARTLGVDVSEQGFIFQIQELVDGEPLDRVLHAYLLLGSDEVARLAAPLARALAEAHASGVVHRDIKPSNIMVTAAEPGLKLLDFGVARLSGDTPDRALTLAGQIAGTPDYMAPERLLSPDGTEASIDVYALGTVLFELLTGRLPHRTHHLAGRTVLDPLSVTELMPQTSAPLAELVMACLARDPAKRPTSAELARAFEKLAELAGPPPLSTLSSGWIQSVRATVAKPKLVPTGEALAATSVSRK